MEELSKVALAYYNNGTASEKKLYAEFFRSLDADGNGQISMREFSEFLMQHEEYEFIPTTIFFDALDRDGSKDLDYHEVLTLYYIVKSGRPVCRHCRLFVAGLYFTCIKCFNTIRGRYCICLECYCGYNGSLHCHGVENFLDNFAMLEDRRKSAIAEEISRQNTQAISFREQSSASSSRSFYPWNVPTALNGFQSNTSNLESFSPWAVPPASNGFVQSLPSSLELVSPWAVPRASHGFQNIASSSEYFSPWNVHTASNGFQSSVSSSEYFSPWAVPVASNAFQSVSRWPVPYTTSDGSQSNAALPPSQTQMVLYNPAASNRFEKWKMALAVLEAGLLIGSLSMGCTIM